MLLFYVAAAVALDVAGNGSAVVGGVVATSVDVITAATPLLAHVNRVTNVTKGRRLAPKKGLTRAEQTVAANDWWCAHSDKTEGLSCRRHRLQQRHQQAIDPVEREAVHHELSALLEGASEKALAALREETDSMLAGFCSLASSRGLEVCVANRDRAKQRTKQQQQQRNRHKKAGKAKAKGQTKGQASQPGGKQRPRPSSSAPPQRRPPTPKHGIAKLWTADNLALLRAWWCADRRHTREPRCSRGVRWTRQQPGLSAMRRLYCAQQSASAADTNTSEKRSAAAKLCAGAGGAAGAAVYEGSSSSSEYVAEMPSELRSGGGIGGTGGARRQRPAHLVRQSTVLKLMCALLALAALLGWKARHHLVGSSTGDKRASDSPAPASLAGGHALPARLAAPVEEDEEDGVVVGAASARRRVQPSKRARPS